MKPNKFSRDWSFRIKDIIKAITKIEQYLDQMTFSEFKKNEMAIDAVVRNFEIIGEAANNIPDDVENANPQVPWKQMVEMRNFLIHEYFGVDLNTVWQTAHKYLPELKEQLLQLNK